MVQAIRPHQLNFYPGQTAVADNPAGMLANWVIDPPGGTTGPYNLEDDLGLTPDQYTGNQVNFNRTSPQGFVASASNPSSDKNFTGLKDYMDTRSGGYVYDNVNGGFNLDFGVALVPFFENQQQWVLDGDDTLRQVDSGGTRLNARTTTGDELRRRCHLLTANNGPCPFPGTYYGRPMLDIWDDAINGLKTWWAGRKGRATWRLGWEMNGNWFYDHFRTQNDGGADLFTRFKNSMEAWASLANTPEDNDPTNVFAVPNISAKHFGERGNSDSWRAAFRAVAQRINTLWPESYIAWCPALGASTREYALYTYPGDDIDHLLIGCDNHPKWSGNNLFDVDQWVDYHRALMTFAWLRGKQYMVGELGLRVTNYRGFAATDAQLLNHRYWIRSMAGVYMAANNQAEAAGIEFIDAIGIFHPRANQYFFYQFADPEEGLRLKMLQSINGQSNADMPANEQAALLRFATAGRDQFLTSVIGGTDLANDEEFLPDVNGFDAFVAPPANPAQVVIALCPPA